MRLVHYGDLNDGRLLNADMASPTRRNSFNKPRHSGILWASPEGSQYGWAEWCQAEEFGDLDTARRWVLNLDERARVFRVRTLDDLIQLVAAYPGPNHGRYGSTTDIDWLRLSDDYDAVHLTDEGQWATRMTTPDLYGWDCESLAIFRAADVCRVLMPVESALHREEDGR